MGLQKTGRQITPHGEICKEHAGRGGIFFPQGGHQKKPVPHRAGAAGLPGIGPRHGHASLFAQPFHAWAAGRHAHGCRSPESWSIFRLKRFAFQSVRPDVLRKKAFFPLTFGRAALCCRLAFRLFQRQNVLCLRICRSGAPSLFPAADVLSCPASRLSIAARLVRRQGHGEDTTVNCLCRDMIFLIIYYYVTKVGQ